MSVSGPEQKCGGEVLTVSVVVVLAEGVAEEERLVKSLGLGDLDGRAGGPEVLLEGLAGLDGSERTGLATAVGVGLDVDGGVALVGDDGLLGGSDSEEGSDGDE